MNWSVLLIGSVLVANCAAVFNVGIANSCGKTFYLGDDEINGFITLLSDDVAQPAAADVPDLCEVYLEGGKGLSLHLRFIMINFLSCDANVKIMYNQKDFLDEVIFNSSPHFCGKEIPAMDPVEISVDDRSTSYKIEFRKDSNENWKKSNFVFDYSTKYLDTDEEIVWPATTTAAPPVIETTTPSAPETTEAEATTLADVEPTTSTDFPSTTWEDVETTTRELEDSTQNMKTTMADVDTTMFEDVDSTAENEPTTASLVQDSTVDDRTTAAEVDVTPTTTMSVETTTDADIGMGTSTMDDISYVSTTAMPIEQTSTAYSEKTTITDIVPSKLVDMETTRPDVQTTENLPPTTEAIVTEPVTTKKILSTTTTSGDKTVAINATSTDQNTTTPTPTLADGPFQCTCSMGFEQKGTHHLLREFPNAIPAAPYNLKIAPGPNACMTAQKTCDNFCKLVVTTNVKSIGGLDRYVIRQDFIKFLGLHSSLRPKLNSSIGGFICENYKSTPLMGSAGAELHVFSHLPQCSHKPKDVALLDSNFCCDGKGEHVDCFAPATINYECKCHLRVNRNYDRDVIGSALPKPINITVPANDPQPCVTGTSKCAQYCKNSAQYKALLRYGANMPSTNTSVAYIGSRRIPKTTVKSVGDRICYNYMFTMPPSRRYSLTMMADIKSCENISSHVGLIGKTGSFCCKNGVYLPCNTYFQPYTRPTVRPTTKAPSITCQCVPQYYNFRSNPIRVFTPVFNTTVDVSRGCHTADNACKKQCGKFLGRDNVPMTFVVTGTKKKIADQTCQQMYSLQTMSTSSLQLYSRVDKRRCPSPYTESLVDTISFHYCCYRGKFMDCLDVANLPKSTTPSYTRATTRPTNTKTIKCQCVPSYYKSTGSAFKERQFPSAYNTTVSYTSGCDRAEVLCKKKCDQYLGISGSRLTFKNQIVKLVANKVCKQIKSYFNPYRSSSDDSLLELYSLVDQKKCKFAAVAPTYIDMLSSDFCCTGGSNSQFITCKNLKRQQGTTYRPPTIRYNQYKCDCKFQVKYSSGVTIRTMNMTSIALDFSRNLGGRARTTQCGVARSSCKRLCQKEVDDVVYDQTIRTPYGYISFEDAVCRKMAGTRLSPMDLVLKTKPTGCGTNVDTGSYYNLDFCCRNGRSSYNCQTGGVIG